MRIILDGNRKFQIAILCVGIISASIAGAAMIMNKMGSEAIQKTIREGNQDTQRTIEESNEKISDKIDVLSQTEGASFERSLEGFKPELKYRVQGIGFNQYKPNSIWYYVTSMNNDHVYVKNKWTITGDICNKDGQSQGTSYSFSNYTYMDLTKEDGEKEGNVKIPDEFFTTFIPDKKSFLLKLELEMNPYTDVGGPFEKKEFPRQTFIQYDLNEERLGWMPWTNPSGYLNCTVVPSIWGRTYLNTSSVHDFYIYKNYIFPEE